MVESAYSSFSPWQNVDRVFSDCGLQIGNTFKTTNRHFTETYMQLGDPLWSCKALKDDQVGYWMGNGRIDRTVEAPIN